MNTAASQTQRPSPNPRGLKSLAYKWDSAELYRAAEAVEEMLGTDGWAALMRLLDEFAESEKNAMFASIASNQIAAAQSAGRVEGLEGAARAAQAIRAAAEAKRSHLEGEGN